MAITEATTTQRIRKSDEQAVNEVAKREKWNGPFPERLSRYLDMLRRAAAANQPKPAHVAKR